MIFFGLQLRFGLGFCSKLGLITVSKCHRLAKGNGWGIITKVAAFKEILE